MLGSPFGPNAAVILVVVWLMAPWSEQVAARVRDKACFFHCFFCFFSPDQVSCLSGVRCLGCRYTSYRKAESWSGWHENTSTMFRVRHSETIFLDLGRSCYWIIFHLVECSAIYKHRQYIEQLRLRLEDMTGTAINFRRQNACATMLSEPEFGEKLRWPTQRLQSKALNSQRRMRRVTIHESDLHIKMLWIRQDTLLGELREDTALFSYRTATKDQEVDANESSLQMLSSLQLSSKIQTCVHVLLWGDPKASGLAPSGAVPLSRTEDIKLDSVKIGMPMIPHLGLIGLLCIKSF